MHSAVPPSLGETVTRSDCDCPVLACIYCGPGVRAPGERCA